MLMRYVLIIVCPTLQFKPCYPDQCNSSSFATFCGGLIAFNVFYFRGQFLKEKFMQNEESHLHAIMVAWEDWEEICFSRVSL